MKPLIAVVCGHVDKKNGRIDAIRETWGHDARQLADVKFFLGYGPNTGDTLDDEVYLPVADGRPDLTYKEAAIMEWAASHNYERVLKTDSDIYADISAIFKSDYMDYDFIGNLQGSNFGEFYRGASLTPLYVFMQGHATWCSQKAVRYLAENLVAMACEGTKQWAKSSAKFGLDTTLSASDVWITQVLTLKWKAGLITVKDDKRYGDGPFTWHLRGTPEEKSRTPEFIRRMHKQVK